MRIGACLVGVLLSIPGGPVVAFAQDEGEADRAEVVTVEAVGALGVQFGDTDYLPDGSPTDYKFPFVYGAGAGVNAGWLFAPDLALIATYEYWAATSVEGDVPDVIDRVQGYVRYHTLILGLRVYRDAGPGRLRADMGVGLVLPFETRTEYDWGQALGAAGISGTGTETDDHSLGFGAQAQLGYEIPAGPVFIGLGLQLRAFQSDNNGEETRLDNMVTDLTAVPPVAVDATIEHGNGQAQPTTVSVQDLGLRIGVGMRF
jgi:hypothetical protein